MTGSHARRLPEPEFTPGPAASTMPDVMAPPEAELAYRTAPAAVPGDEVLLLLQRAASMAGVSNQVRRAMSWLVLHADLVAVPDGGKAGRDAVVAQAAGLLRAGAAPAPRPRRRAGRGGRGRGRKPAEAGVPAGDAP